MFRVRITTLQRQAILALAISGFGWFPPVTADDQETQPAHASDEITPRHPLIPPPGPLPTSTETRGYWKSENRKVQGDIDALLVERRVALRERLENYRSAWEAEEADYFVVIAAAIDLLQAELDSCQTVEQRISKRQLMLKESLDRWRRIHALYQAGRRGGEAEKEAAARAFYFKTRLDVLKEQAKLPLANGAPPLIKVPEGVLPDEVSLDRCLEEPKYRDVLSQLGIGPSLILPEGEHNRRILKTSVQRLIATTDVLHAVEAAFEADKIEYFVVLDVQAKLAMAMLELCQTPEQRINARQKIRNAQLETWRRINALYQTGRRGGEAEKEASARVYFFEAQAALLREYAKLASDNDEESTTAKTAAAFDIPAGARPKCVDDRLNRDKPEIELDEAITLLLKEQILARRDEVAACEAAHQADKLEIFAVLWTRGKLLETELELCRANSQRVDLRRQIRDISLDVWRRIRDLAETGRHGGDPEKEAGARAWYFETHIELLREYAKPKAENRRQASESPAPANRENRSRPRQPEPNPAMDPFFDDPYEPVPTRPIENPPLPQPAPQA